MALPIRLNAPSLGDGRYDDWPPGSAGHIRSDMHIELRQDDKNQEGDTVLAVQASIDVLADYHSLPNFHLSYSDVVVMVKVGDFSLTVEICMFG